MSYLPPPPRRPSSHPPTTLPATPAGQPWNRKRAALIALVLLSVTAALSVGGWVLMGRRTVPQPEESVVRVRAGNSSGTGFFVTPPKGESGVLVVTAFHVIDSGDPIIVERVVHSSSTDTYVEAYPETELAAFDATQDLAVVRIKRVPSSKVRPLPLADHADKDAALVSYGFPASTLTSRLGLVKKEGKLLEIVKLTEVDPVYHRVVRDDAIDGMIISSDLEPGFSGGPTCNAKGEVVGVNLLKDSEHRGQNGAVSSHAVLALLTAMKPAAAPTPQEVADLLKSIQDQDLLLPVDDRTKLAEHEMIALSDVPRLRSLIGELRQMDADTTERDLGDGRKASGRALLGIMLARLPGKSLETYTASSTQTAVRKCADRSRNLRGLLGDAAEDDSDSGCERLAIRPLAWDLTAVTLEWSGAPRAIEVTKIEEVDSEAGVFRASVKMSSLPSLIPVYVTRSGGRLRLELFSKKGWLYALEGSRGAVGHDYDGAWVAKHARTPDAKMSGVDEDAEEHLVVTIQDTDTVVVTHRFTSSRYAAKGAIFSCNHRTAITTSGDHRLSGKLQNGVIVGVMAHEDPPDTDCKVCGLCVTSDKMFVMKIDGAHLLMVRTNGSAAPETMSFSRE